MCQRMTFCADSREVGLTSVQSTGLWQTPGLSMRIRGKFPDYWKGRNEIETHYRGKGRFCAQGGTGVTPFSESGQTASENSRNTPILLEGRQNRRPETVGFLNPVWICSGFRYSSIRGTGRDLLALCFLCSLPSAFWFSTPLVHSQRIGFARD